MADLLASGAAWLTARLKAAAGTTVTYTRAGESAEVVATIGRSEFETANQSGIIERWESRDFLISTEDLPFGIPLRGDEIIEVRGGDIVSYEVSSPRGVPEWHYGDAFRSIVRVHTTANNSAGNYLVSEAGDNLITEAGETLMI